MTKNGSRVEAKAEKRFFIEMLVKDIELLPAIVDLVDNSIDAARRLHKDGSLEGQWVDIEVTAEYFTIKDNSGGMDIDVARDYAFRFGRALGFHGVPRSVGQFGVGMKRAIFKIGDEFEIESAYRELDGSGTRGDSRFTLTVDVDEWERHDDWSFTLGPHEEQIKLPTSTTAGTTITIRKLHPSVADDFQDGAIVDDLKRELRLRHQESLDRGLVLKVGGEPQTSTRPSLQESPLLSPIRRAFSVPTANGETVAVEIFAGTVQGETKREGADPVDLADAESFQDPSDAGWYLFCNDRLLMVADTSSVTGWGSSGAAFHPQYRLFRGYVYLNADDASVLPWNTTKTAVDRDSPVFRAVASEMKSTLVEVQAAINKQEKVRRACLAESRELEAMGIELPHKPDLLRAFDETENVPLRNLPSSPKMIIPPEPPKTKKPSPPPSDSKRIQYEVPLEEFQRTSEVLGTSSGSEVGRQTFAYFYEAEVD